MRRRGALGSPHGRHRLRGVVRPNPPVRHRLHLVRRPLRLVAIGSAESSVHTAFLARGVRPAHSPCVRRPESTTADTHQQPTTFWTYPQIGPAHPPAGPGHPTVDPMPPNAFAAAAALVLVPSAVLASVPSFRPDPSTSTAGSPTTLAASAPRIRSSPTSGVPPPRDSTRWRAGLSPVTRPPVSARRAGIWRWPLSPPPAVLRRFVVGPHRWSPGHRGVDLAATATGLIYAPADGVVTFARSVVDRPVLVISHAGGIRTAYEPVLSAVPSGTPVTQGTVVGRLVASTGHCPPRPCLHWSARRADRYVDPLSLLATPRIALLPVSRGSSRPDP